MASLRFFQEGRSLLVGLAILNVANVKVGTGRIVGAMVGSETIKVGAALMVGIALVLCGVQLEAAGTTIKDAITKKIGMAISLLCRKSLNIE
jgi:hypothetical protein